MKLYPYLYLIYYFYNTVDLNRIKTQTPNYPGIWKPIRYTIDGGVCATECKLKWGSEWCKFPTAADGDVKCRSYTDTNYLKSYIMSYLQELEADYAGMATRLTQTATVLDVSTQMYNASKPKREAMTTLVFEGDQIMDSARSLFVYTTSLEKEVKYWISQNRKMSKALRKVAKYKYLKMKGDCEGLPGYKSDTLGNGIVGRYYNGINFRGLFNFRLDSSINFFWNDEQPIRNIGSKNWGIEWIGYIKPPVNDSYTFMIDCDDGCYVVLGEDAIIQDRLVYGDPFNDWLARDRKEFDEKIAEGGLRAYSVPATVEAVEKIRKEKSKSKPISLEGGKFYPLKVRAVHSVASNLFDTGFSYVKLYWSNADFEKEIIKKEYLFEYMETSPFYPKGYDATKWTVSTMEENGQAFMDDKTYRLKYIPHNSHGNFRLMTLSTYEGGKLSFTLKANSRIYIGYPDTIQSPVSGFKPYDWDMALLRIKATEYDDLKNGKQLEADEEVSLTIVSKDFSAGTINIVFTASESILVVVWIGYVSEAADSANIDGKIVEPPTEEILGENKTGFVDEQKVIEERIKKLAENKDMPTGMVDINVYRQGNLNTYISSSECTINLDACKLAVKEAGNQNYWDIPENSTDHILTVTFKSKVKLKYIVFRQRLGTFTGAITIYYNDEKFETIDLVNLPAQVFQMKNSISTEKLLIFITNGSNLSSLNLQFYGSLDLNTKEQIQLDEEMLVKLSKRKDDPEVRMLICMETLQDLAPEIGKKYQFVCLEDCDPNNPNYMLFGDMEYHEESNVCLAAKFQGISPDTTFNLQVKKGIDEFKSAKKNGVESSKAYDSQYSFVIDTIPQIPTFEALEEVEVIDEDAAESQCYVRGEYISKLSDTESEVSIDGLKKTFKTWKIGRCGQRILGPCRETGFLMINFVDFKLKDKILNYSAQTKENIMDFGELFSVKLNNYEYGWDIINTHYGVSLAEDNLKENFGTSTGVILSPDAKSTHCRVQEKVDQCTHNNFKIKLAKGNYEVTVKVGNLDSDHQVSANLKVNDEVFFDKEEVQPGNVLIKTKKINVDNYDLILSNACTGGKECKNDSTQLLTMKVKSINIVGNSPVKSDLGYQSFRNKECFTEDPINCVFRESELKTAPACPNLMKLPKNAEVESIRCDYKCYEKIYDFQEDCQSSCVPPMKCKKQKDIYKCLYND